MKNSNKIEHPKVQKIIQIISLIAFFILYIILINELIISTNLYRIPLIIFSIPIGLILADFFSGLFHWAADTWGSVNWPIIGSTILLSFRNHHTDPKGIIRHKFYQRIGDSCIFALPILISTYYINSLSLFAYFIKSILLVFLLGIALTNQIHCWAHMKKVPKIIYYFQKTKIILSADKHKIHHNKPFSENYCITTGWLNELFTKIHFFRRMEKLVTFLTGALPRSEDKIWHNS